MSQTYHAKRTSYHHLLELHEYQFKWKNDEDTQIKSSISNEEYMLKDEIEASDEVKIRIGRVCNKLYL